MFSETQAWLRGLQAAHPAVRVFTIGYSLWLQPLYALAIGRGPRKVLINASHHANEWITTGLLLRFAAARAAGPPDGVTLYAVPLVNPDGVDMARRGWVSPAWKANARGVDLNANYPAGWEQARDIKKARGYDAPGPREYMGAAPLSEPESYALAAFTRRIRPDVTVSLHTQGEEIYWRYGDDAPGARALAEAMAEAGGYRLADAPGESAHAGYKDWFIRAFNRPGFTIECGLGENPLPEADAETIYPRLERMLDVIL